MPEITNRASLTYSYGQSGTVAQALSNVASITLNGAITGSKTSLGSTYRNGDDITYIITLQNTSQTPKTDVQITDNLGTYVLADNTTTATPLTYVGPAQLYINGNPSGELTPTVTPSNIIFTVPLIPAAGNVVIVYKVLVNEYAPLATGGTIVNTVSYAGSEACNDFSVDNTVTVEDIADVKILKTMSPDPIVCGAPITYTFTLSNYGNTDATNIVLTDTFSPAPATITVTLNGVVVDASEYTYTGGVLTYGAGTTPLTLPAATFTTSDTGAVTVTPSVSTVIVSGVITTT